MSLQLPSLILRDVTQISELHEVEQLQKEVWGVADLEVVPALALIPMIEVGGVLIGAFDQGADRASDRNPMVGFVFGFPGQENGKLILHSDMLAVRPEYRRHGLGFKLKLAQREKALSKGIDTITWTFDPLQARNARLNFGKLGVVSDSYRVNYYGKTTSFLHQTGTDRLWVTWNLESDRVRRRVEGSYEPSPDRDESITVLSVSENEEPCAIGEIYPEMDIAIEIPEDINIVTDRDAAKTERWRAATRTAFTTFLERGFSVTEFEFVAGINGRVGRYLLSRPR